MSFNYPKIWKLAVKFLKTFLKPRSAGFMYVNANFIRPDIKAVFPEIRRNDYSTTSRK